jgi:RNA exonuclease 4
MMPAPSEFLALDCEMVGIGPDGHTSSVARVTLIDWSGETLLDEYIQQTEPVTDYRTHVSGITEEQLQTATCTSLADCQTQVLDLLESRILVGHALKNDLRALEISHPWWLTRDTAKYEPFMQVRFDDGILWPRKLKDLCSETLHRDIQVSGSPHCPYEDALAALDLYRSARGKWEKVIRYKWNRTNQILKQQQQ